MITLNVNSLPFRIVFFLVTFIPFITFIVSAAYLRKIGKAYDSAMENSGTTPDYGISRKQIKQMYTMMIILSVVFALFSVVAVYLLVFSEKKVEQHKEKIKKVINEKTKKTERALPEGYEPAGSA